MYNIAVAMVLAVLKSRYGRMQLMNVIVAGPREWWYLITEDKIIIENEAKIASWIDGI